MKSTDKQVSRFYRVGCSVFKSSKNQFIDDLITRLQFTDVSLVDRLATHFNDPIHTLFVI